MEKKWWHGKVAYQIYPKSFLDSNNDGIGDLGGIIQKLDYLHDLGIEILWLSPIYPSPFYDQGYDIKDYYDIDPTFGTMQDFDLLLEKAKKLNIKIVMDLVLNHCSIEHIWFKKACLDVNLKEASYFYIREGKNGQPPNNQRACFGGSVWDKLPNHDNLYYAHFFTKEQPDLNWFNADLRAEMYKIVNFWLDKGVSGFRIDAIMCIAKDPNFPMYESDSEDGTCSHLRMNKENIKVAYDFIRDLRDNTFKKHKDSIAIAEAFGVLDEDLSIFIGDDGLFDCIFDFSAREAVASYHSFYGYKMLSVKEYKDAIFSMQKRSNNTGFVCPLFENHDEPRGVSTYLPKAWQNDIGAKALALITLFLRGMPFLFQGSEIGMQNTKFESIDEFDDILSKNEYKNSLEHGLTKELALDILNVHARDHGRTPMLWDDSEYAAFSTHKPWMKVSSFKDKINVKAQLEDKNSILNFYKTLIALKKDERFNSCLTYGDFVEIESRSDDTIAYKREGSYIDIYVIANLGLSDISYTFDFNFDIIISNDLSLVLKDKNTLYIKRGGALAFVHKK